MDLSFLPWTARAALLALFAAALLRALLLRLRARREAARARRALGDPRRSIGHLEGLSDGDRVTLIGTLEAKGALCPRFEDGALVAAATARAEGSPAPVSARAERLKLTIDDRAVEILGPIEVLVGSREAWPGVAVPRLAVAVRHRIVEAGEEAAPGGGDPNLRGPVRLRSLRSGDRVRASGVLTRGGAPSAVHAYRDAAAPWTLSGDPAGLAVQLACEGPPRVRGPIGAIASGLRDTRRFAVAVVVTALGLLAVAALSTLTWQRDPSAAVSQKGKPRPRFGDANQCRTLGARYVAARDRQNHCAEDDDCDADIRGEQWIELDGCFRFKNRREPMVAVDALGQAWFEEGCSTQYEICGIVPQTMCRRGQCMERPPAPIPEDWTRQDIGHLFTFFGPPGLKPVHSGGNCTGGLSYGFEREGLSIWVDYDNNLSPPEDARTMKLGRQTAQMSWFERGDPLEALSSKYGVVAYFPEVPLCPSMFCSGSGRGKFAMQVTAYCRTRSDADLATKALESIRQW